MNVLWTSPLGPVVWLTGGAALLMAGQKHLPCRWQRRLPRLWMALGLLAWLALRFQTQQAPMLWQWHIPLDISIVFGLQLDAWAWMVGLAVLVVTLIAPLLSGATHDTGYATGPLWMMLLAAAGLLAVLALSWMNLLAAWAAMWLLVGVVAPAPGRTHIWTAGILSTTFLWMAALWDPAALVWQLIPGTQLNPLPQLLLVGAVSIALGVTPFHLTARSADTPAPGPALLLYLIPALAALHLLGSLSLPLLSVSSWLFLVAVALLGSSLAAWTEDHPARYWRSILINRSAWVLFMVALVAVAPPANLLLPLTTLFLGALMWGMAAVAQARYHWRLPHWLAFMTLYGLPLTPAFNLMGFWHRLTNSVIGIPLWMIYLLAQSLLVAAFLRPPLVASPARRSPPRLFSWGVTALGAVILWWGLFPSTLGVWGAGLSPDSPDAVFFAPLHSATGIDWLTLLLPLAVGGALARLHRRTGTTLGVARARVATLARMDWLSQAGERLLHGLSLCLGVLADVLDGAGQFGWVLLALLIGAILLRS